MAAVALRGPAHTAPEAIFGPFATLEEAAAWAAAHPRGGGYCVPVELSAPDTLATPAAG